MSWLESMYCCFDKQVVSQCCTEAQQLVDWTRRIAPACHLQLFWRISVTVHLLHLIYHFFQEHSSTFWQNSLWKHCQKLDWWWCLSVKNHPFLLCKNIKWSCLPNRINQTKQCTWSAVLKALDIRQVEGRPLATTIRQNLLQQPLIDLAELSGPLHFQFTLLDSPAICDLFCDMWCVWCLLFVLMQFIILNEAHQVYLYSQ